MNEAPEEKPPEPVSPLSREVGAKAARKLKAQRQVTPGIWFGLGMMGLIGWSITIPTLLGAGLGLWLDRHYPGPHSWTLALLVGGLVIGCWNAWHWVAREQQEMHEEDTDDE
jgi:ATP synthase protein I